MSDTTPPPYGDVTRQWTHLPEPDKQHHARRLLGDLWTAPFSAPVTDPTPAQYARLVRAARAGDELAFAWIATTHRPMVLAAGRALLEDDPAEWGSTCLELLHTNLLRAQLDSGIWLRRHIATRLKSELAAQVRRHLARRRTERATDPVVDLPRLRTDAPTEPEIEDNLELATDLSRALRRYDRPTFEGLLALGEGTPLSAVADHWGLSHATLRQRVTRARTELQPELAHYRRGVA